MYALPNVLAADRGARAVTAVLVAFALVAASAVSAQAVTPETYAVSHVSQLGQKPAAVAVDESTHDVFVPNADDGTVSIINGTTVTSVAVGGRPVAVALNQNTDTAYILSHVVSVIRGGVVTGTVPVGATPTDVAVDQSDGTIYVANYSGNSVTIINPATLATSTLALAGNPYSIAIDSATHTVYVGTRVNSTAVIRGGAVVMNVPGGYKVAFNEVNGMVYTIDETAPRVYAIDGANVTAIAVGQTPHELAINQTTGTVYVANLHGNSVTVIDGTTVSSTVGLSSSPYAIAADSGSNAVYVSLRVQARLAVIEGTTVVATPLVGIQPDAVTVDNSTGTAYVASEGSRTLATVIKTTLEQPPFIVSLAPRNGKAEAAYSFDVLATGNPAPTSYAVTAGTLPAGLTINAATGAITGTPTAAGSFPFTLTVANGTSPNATANYTLVIAPPDFSSGPPPSGTVGSGFSFVFTPVTPGLAIFSIPSGLPPGVTLNSSGVLSGTPTVAGSFPVTINAFSFGAGSLSASYTINILPTPVPAVITSATPGGGTVGTSYSFLVAASGVPAATFAVDSGILPPGLVLDAVSGAITGTPTDAGSWLFTVSATSAGNAADTADYTIRILPTPVPAQITSSAPGAGTVGVSYSFLVAASGVPAATFAVDAGILPPGLVLDAVSGAITGTPTDAGSWLFTVSATSAGNAADTADYTVTIAAAPVRAVITSSAPGGGTVGASYSFRVAASGVPAPTFAVDAGVLPPGLALDAVTGAITGTPTQAGSWQFTLSATSVGNAAATAEYTVAIAVAPVPIADPAPPVSPDVTLDPAPAAGALTDLASTGVDVRAPLAIATLLLLAGAGLFLATRRRNA